MAISTLFIDIGGVLLTNGWDHQAREKAIAQFQLNEKEFNARHSLLFDTFEIGKMTLDDYIEQSVFNEPRQFSLEDFKQFMFEQSKPFLDMLEFMQKIKQYYPLKIVALSNEGKELMIHRMHAFHLKSFIDFFVCSSFVHLRKPDLEIYHLALNITQSKPEEVIYIDDRPLLAEIGEQLGLKTIHHVSYENTCKRLEEILKG